MNIILKTENTLVLRTDFSDKNQWLQICAKIETPDPVDEFRACVTFLSDPQYKDISIGNVISLINPKDHWFIFVVDHETILSPKHHILCIDFLEKPGNTFRLIPSEMWGVENNLSICNMEFSDFKDNADSDGVFRGFK
jgi:hypothetical protein